MFIYMVFKALKTFSVSLCLSVHQWLCISSENFLYVSVGYIIMPVGGDKWIITHFPYIFPVCKEFIYLFISLHNLHFINSHEHFYLFYICIFFVPLICIPPPRALPPSLLWFAFCCVLLLFYFVFVFWFALLCFLISFVFCLVLVYF